MFTFSLSICLKQKENSNLKSPREWDWEGGVYMKYFNSVLLVGI